MVRKRDSKTNGKGNGKGKRGAGMGAGDQVGQRIRQLREARKLSQETLAPRIGVKTNAVNRWERGESKPSVVNLYRVALFFEKPMEYFMKEETP